MYILFFHFLCKFILSYTLFCKLFICKYSYSNNIKPNNHNSSYFSLKFPKGVSYITSFNASPNFKSIEDDKSHNSSIRLTNEDAENLDDDVARVLYGIENPENLTGPYISPEGKIINKKKKLYSTGELCHVDDFFEGKFRVEWTVRGVKEKLQYRYRDTHTLPLTTSRFTLSGIKGFVLRLWLDGHKGSKKGHIAMSLVQLERWTSLDSPICLFAGNIVRGPFFYRSPEYFLCAKSFCRLEDVIENNTLKLGVMIAKRPDSSNSSQQI